MRFVEYVRGQGYRRFYGSVDQSVYRAFGCAQPGKAVWHVKDGSFQCTGCREQCETDSPEGFQTSLFRE